MTQFLGPLPGAKLSWRRDDEGDDYSGDGDGDGDYSGDGDGDGDDDYSGDGWR